MAYFNRLSQSLMPMTPPASRVKREDPATPAIEMGDDTWPDYDNDYEADEDMFGSSGQLDGDDDGTIALTTEEDEFVDAAETLENMEVDQHTQTDVIDMAGFSSSEDAEGDDDPMEDLERAADRRSSTPAVIEEQEDAEDEDLFTSTFGKKASQPLKVEDDEFVQETYTVAKDAGNDRFQQAFLKAVPNANKHKNGCNGNRGASTPPPSPSQIVKPESRTPQATIAPAEWFAPDPEKDLSKQLKRHQRNHDRAKKLIPRLPLAPHRYWVGVLNIDKQWKKDQKEKDFTWMKGSRFTTIETVWHTYETTTAMTGFVLMLGQQRMEFKDQAQELDLFNDKVIVLRAVMEGTPESKGKEISDGIVPPEIVEIDDN